MLVAGPAQFGKTQWTVKFLKERNQRIDPPVDDILFCYSEWQDKYDTLMREVPTTKFHKVIPELDTLKSLQNVILVIDDLMEEAINDQNIRTLAIQIFPTNWNDFLAYYGKETSKEYGCCS